MPLPALFFMLGLAAGAQEPKLKPGDMAPNFTLTADNGQQVRLSDYRGKTVVLAFVVKAFTGG